MKPFGERPLGNLILRAQNVWRFAPDFLLIAWLTPILIALILINAASVLSLVRIGLGLAFVLLVPGYSLHAALFPHAGELDTPERLAISFGLSIAIVPPLALILDRLPWGIRLWPILIGLLTSIALFSGIALYRRYRLPPAQRPQFRLQLELQAWWATQDRLNQWLYGAFVLAVLGASLASIIIIIAPKSGEQLTEFYILGSEGLAENYPREAIAGQPITVTVGIANHEGQRMVYTLQAEVNAQVVGFGPILTLETGEVWEQSFSFILPEPGDNQPIDFKLGTSAQATYRTLRLWLNVLPLAP